MSSTRRVVSTWAQFFLNGTRELAQAKLIAFACAWVNDQGTKRTGEGADDTYRVFRPMLNSGRPPSAGAR